MLKKINWPTAAVAISGLVLLGAVALFGKEMGIPEDIHTKVLAALGSVEAIVLAFMRQAMIHGGEPKKDDEEK